MRRAALLTTLLAGCAPATPEAPTWLADVRPILAANCVRCHGVPAQGGAPSTFRLDVYDDAPGAAPGLVVRGAAAMAPFVAARASELEDMPPRGTELSGRQKDILAAWVDAPAKGVRPGNRPPEARLATVPGAAEAVAVLDVAVTDPDRDLVTGTLRAGDRILGALRAGTQRIVWDTSAVPAGAHALAADLDDGSGVVVVELGAVTVEHPQGLLPEMVFDSPRLDDILADGEQHTISLRVSNPSVMVTLVAFDGRQEVALGEHPVPAVASLPFDTADLPSGANWRLRATASSQPPQTVTSAPFIISHGTTTHTYVSLQPVLTGACAGCHDGNLVSGYDFAKFTADDLRVLRGPMYRKVVQSREMPPESASVVLSSYVFAEEARAMIGEWLLAGAPP
jgi:mono/diheme cytochrome c family protein